MSKTPLALSVSNLTLSYEDEPVVEAVSFSLDMGRLVAIVGPNGAGKSTMIKAMVGVLDPDSGEVAVFGKTGKSAHAHITYVPQRGSVDWDFPVTVWDVVAQGRYRSLGLLRRLRGENKKLVQDAIEKVGMTAYIDRQIGELSGGQQQRVFLARALAQQGDVYLMDEPFVGVDATTERAIVDVLQTLRDQGKLVLVVHHDLSTVREYFDSMLLMNRKLYAIGDIEDVFTKKHLQAAYGGKLAVFDDGDVAVMS